MGKPPGEAQRDQHQYRYSEGEMECHGGAGLHIAVNVRHQPADQVLHQ
jgi:hypothetical protein